MKRQSPAGIVLIGYRGSGKSTVAEILARRFSWPPVDTDSMIIKDAGMSIREIFERYGEAHFRDLEAKALLSALAGGKSVIATGGGIVMREENRRRLKKSGYLIVYLAAAAELLLERVSADPASRANRPNLTSAGGLAEIRHMLELRDPLYREVAHHVVDAARPAGDIAQVITDLLTHGGSEAGR